MYQEPCLTIDGHAVAASTHDYEAVRNSATGAVLGFPLASSGDVNVVLESSQRAFDSWKNLPARERAAILKRGSQVIRDRLEVVAQILTLEQGQPLAEARSRWAGGHASGLGRHIDRSRLTHATSQCLTPS